MFKYIITATKAMTQSYRYMMEYQGPEYNYEQSHGQIVDDMNDRVGIKSKGD